MGPKITVLTGLKMASIPYFLFLQPNKKWVGSILKTRDETKQEMGRLHPQNEGWNQPILLVPQPNTRLVGPAVEPDRNRARLACRPFVACDSAGPEKRRFLSEIVFGKEMHAVSRACFWCFAMRNNIYRGVREREVEGEE